MVYKRFKKGSIPWNKGKKGIYSKETRKKMGESRKKTMSTPESQKKMSESQKKRFEKESSWMKGKKHRPESLLKMSESHKKILSNPEVRKRMSQSQKKRFSNLEERRKQSEVIKKSWNNSELRKKQSEAHSGQIPFMKGKKHRPESLLKMSESHKEQIANPEVRKKMSKITKKLWDNPEFRKRQIKARKGHHFSPKTEFKKGIKPWNKGVNFPEDSERTERQIKIAKNSRERILKMYESGNFPKQTNTKPERQIKEELLKRGYKEKIDFIHQYNFRNKFSFDFCFPQQKLIVEAHGDYWHAHPIKYPIPKKPHQKNTINSDNKKEAYISVVDNHSWTFLVFWESDIKSNVSKCVDKIEEVLAEKKKI